MLDWFAERWNDFITWGLSLVLSVYDMLIDAFCFVLESVFDGAVVIVDGFGFGFGTFAPLQYLTFFPSDMINVMALCGVNEVSVIIISAVAARFVLQLIPFVRLGS